ncbi:hypothetical protein C2S51_035111 [Perilla frutescens var. frutescens]|nr:hypothetical protein C2S51_035111 [Perilla frutescens var. frutescens]
MVAAAEILNETSSPSAAKAIEEVCRNVSFPTTCRDTLSAAAPNISDPKRLMQMSEELLIKELRKEIKFIEKTKNATVDDEDDIDPFGAYTVCHRYFSQAISSIREEGDIDGANGQLESCNNSLTDYETGATYPDIDKDYYGQHLKLPQELARTVQENWLRIHTSKP